MFDHKYLVTFSNPQLNTKYTMRWYTGPSGKDYLDVYPDRTGHIACLKELVEGKEDEAFAAIIQTIRNEIYTDSGRED